MKTIIAGSRTITDRRLVFDILRELDFITEVVCGCARGIDTLGSQWAKTQDLPVKHFPADWKKFGKSAGPIRNKQMAEYGEALVLIHKGTPGSMNMLKLAKEKGLLIREFDLRVNKSTLDLYLK